MPPVPVHIDDPITPQKAQQPATDSPAAPPAPIPAPPYPAAQPGAAAFPAPTSSVASPHAPPPPPTRTTQTAQYEGPPPPRPGAVPAPPMPQAYAPMATATSSLPPPPKAGEAARQRASSITTAMPPQMAMPAPQPNLTPTRGTRPDTTMTAAAAGRTGGGGTTLHFGAVPQPAPAAAQHPPGYQQNVYAQELSSAQRASLDATERRESLVESLGWNGDEGQDTAGQVWNAVKGWANVAGAKLEEVHTEAWKRINGE